MAVIGFHASHELYPSGELLRHVRLAEQAGFEAAMCSDHFHSWKPRQGQSGFWRFAAGLAAAALLAINLSMSAANNTNWRLGRELEDGIAGSDRESQRQALLLHARSRLTPGAPVSRLPSSLLMFSEE